jgi:hypothetical protein
MNNPQNPTTSRKKAIRSLITAAKLEYFKRHHARADADYVAVWYGPARGRYYRNQTGEWRLVK